MLSFSHAGNTSLDSEDPLATLRNLKFKNDIFSYLETFGSNDNQPGIFAITITPKEIQLTPGDIDLIADWA